MLNLQHGCRTCVVGGVPGFTVVLLGCVHSVVTGGTHAKATASSASSMRSIHESLSKKTPVRQYHRPPSSGGTCVLGLFGVLLNCACAAFFAMTTASTTQAHARAQIVSLLLLLSATQLAAGVAFAACHARWQATSIACSPSTSVACSPSTRTTVEHASC